jgi:hypothetical protein
MLIRVNSPEDYTPSAGGQSANSKSQISNIKQITIIEIQNYKHEYGFKKEPMNAMFWSLDIVIWNLFEIWCL